MDYYGSNDWWDYLAHARKAQERPDHKYVARVEVGVKKGKTLYRYFYSQKEYEAYLKGNIKGDKKQWPVSEEEVAERLRKIGVDMADITVTDVRKDEDGNLHIDYQTGHAYYHRTFMAPFSLKRTLTKAKKAVNALQKRASEFIKKVASKVLSKEDADAGKAFVDTVIAPENPVKEYKVSEVGVRARSHTYVAKVELPNGKHRYFYSEDDYQRYLARQKYQEESPDFMKDVPRQDVVMTDETRSASMAEINEEFSWSDPQRSMNCMYCTTAYELRQRGYDVQAADRGSEEEYDGYVSSLCKWYENPTISYMSQDGTVKDASYVYETDNLFHRIYDELKPAYDKARSEYEELYDKSNWLEKTVMPSTELKYAKAKMDDAKAAYDEAHIEWYKRESSPEYQSVNKDMQTTRNLRATATYTGKEVFEFVKAATEPNSRGNFMVYWAGGAGHSMIYETDSHGNVTIRDSQINRVYQPIDLSGHVVFMQIARTDNLKLKPGILITVEAN